MKEARPPLLRWVVSALAIVVFLAGCSDADGAPPTGAAVSTTTTVAPTTATLWTTTPSTAAPPEATSTQPPTDLERCLRRAVFENPAASPYVLPYPPGEGYTIIQSYCNDDGSHESQLAYDFAMPLGSLVVAARGGVVVEVKEDVPNDEYSRFLNQVLIRHDDGTVGFYAHLQHLGALVEVGDEVDQGDEIGLSGATGRTGGPVLHFGVFSTWPPLEGRDEPVVFRNADGPTDKRGGLRQGSFYRATPAP